MLVQIGARIAEVQDSRGRGDTVRMNAEDVLLGRVKIGGLFTLQWEIVDHALPESQSSQPVGSSTAKARQEIN